jgi:hypothetical protein
MRREVMLVAPFRGFGSAARTETSPPRTVLSGQPLVQSHRPPKYRRYWLGDPTLPLAISSALWFSFGGPHCPQLSRQRIHSSSLASRKSYPAEPSRPAAAGQHLSWACRPYSTFRSCGSTLCGLCLTASFRLQGLTTLLTAYSPQSAPVLFHTSSALGIHPSELSPLEKVSTRFRAEEPTYRFPCRYTRTCVQAGSTGRGSWALTLPGVPGGSARC